MQIRVENKNQKMSNSSCDFSYQERKNFQNKQNNPEHMHIFHIIRKFSIADPHL